MPSATTRLGPTGSRTRCLRSRVHDDAPAARRRRTASSARFQERPDHGSRRELSRAGRFAGGRVRGRRAGRPVPGGARRAGGITRPLGRRRRLRAPDGPAPRRRLAPRPPRQRLRPARRPSGAAPAASRIGPHLGGAVVARPRQQGPEPSIAMRAWSRSRPRRRSGQPEARPAMSMKVTTVWSSTSRDAVRASPSASASAHLLPSWARRLGQWRRVSPLVAHPHRRTGVCRARLANGRGVPPRRHRPRPGASRRRCRFAPLPLSSMAEAVDGRRARRAHRRRPLQQALDRRGVGTSSPVSRSISSPSSP